MSEWAISRTDTFLKSFKKYRKDNQVILELDKKIQRLKISPESIGGYLSGSLHGYKATRLVGKIRLIFSINNAENAVYLEWIDHRGQVYD